MWSLYVSLKLISANKAKAEAQERRPLFALFACIRKHYVLLHHVPWFYAKKILLNS